MSSVTLDALLTKNMTDTLAHLGFKLSEIAEISNFKEDLLCETDGFESILMCDELYTPPEFEPTLKNKLQEISILNDVTFEDSITPQSTGIEASDVGSLFQQFLEYEQASDADPLSYAGSSIMSPEASPGEQNEDVLGRLICVQEKLSREVGSDGETTVDVVCNDNLIMNIPNDDKLLRTVNGVHPKGNLLRMADSPKFAKFKKKRLTKEPPLRIASSLPNTPRCTSPSDVVNAEERKHMEIKLIEALALPMPKQNLIKSSRDNQKKVSSSCPKRKQPPVEPTPSRLLPVVSKRQRNNLEKNKLVKDPRLNIICGSVDPRLNKADYGTKSNVIQLQNTNLIEINSSTNTATETVDDVGIIDMTIDHDNLPETFILVPDVLLNEKRILVSETPVINEMIGISETVAINEMIGISETVAINEMISGISETVPISEMVTLDQTVDLTVQNGIITPNDTIDTLKIVEFPSIAAIEIKTEEVCETTMTNEMSSMKSKEELISGLIKPQKNYRKGLSNSLDGTFFSASEHESDDDDRAYHRKKSSKKSRVSSNPKASHPSSIKSEIMRSSSLPRKTSKDNSRHSSTHRPHSRHKQRSASPSKSKLRSDKYSSESSFSNSDRSDSESIDISNKLIELSNPVPYDIEHERKLRFLSGGASKGMGERKNIYAGGITEDTTKAELGERFRRFGEIVKITLHFRDKGDNYAFIVFEDPDNAMRAIEEGNDDTSYPHLDLCFGGRRKFVGGSYVDFDGNNRYLEESDKANVNNRCDEPEDDFDRLLQIAMNEKKKRQATPAPVEVKKRDPTPESPEWS